jgi:iron(III) transport system substrate-binding protein
MSKSSNPRILLPILGLLTSLLAPPVLAGEEINVYSARKEDLIKPLLDTFSQQTGITVNLATGKEEALLQRLQSEGANTPADLLLTSDAGRLAAGAKTGVLQAVQSDTLNKNIPAAYRDPAGYWYGCRCAPAPILYAKSRVKPEQLSTYEALAGPQWRGKLCLRSSDSVYNQSLVAGMIAHPRRGQDRNLGQGAGRQFRPASQGRRPRSNQGSGGWRVRSDPD